MDKRYSITVETHSEADTVRLGARIGARMAEFDKPLCVALVGDLGTGKTHLTQGIGKGFGVTEEITSPTFALMNTYETEHGVLYHFDVYRLDEPGELETIGFYEYTEGQKSVVEWADKFSHELPDETLWVHLNRTGEEDRRIILESDYITDTEMTDMGGNYVAGN